MPVHRLVFHEITEEAIREALKHPRQIDDNLVRAQEMRRIIDRLYGYDVSPLLWRKIRPRLSAGRVQSVAVRLIVERERQRMAFVPATYWDLLGTFANAGGESFQAELMSVDGRRMPTSRDFDPATGKLKDPALLAARRAAGGRAAPSDFAAAPCRVAESGRQAVHQRPYPPFTTSTLQQEANRKYGFTARQTMQVAQSLYENGHITYMRTDSTNLAAVAVEAARALVASQYGREYLPAAPRVYQTKVKNAQEAHEAIRPAGHPFDLPGIAPRTAPPDEFKLYDLIWKRTVASQMADARGHRMTITVEGGGAVFQVSGKTIEFPGYLRAYVEGSDDPEGRTGRPRGSAAAGCRGRIARVPRVGAEEPHHAAAQPLQRGLADPGAGRDGHRPAQHLRLDHRHDPGPRVRVQAEARQRAGAHLDGVRRLAVARRTICPSWSITSSRPRWKTSWTPSAAAR